MWTAADYDKVIDTLGLNAILHIAKSPADVKPVKVGFATATKEDTALVNSYGVGARIITIKASETTQPPVKFDHVMIGAEKFVFDTVTDVHLPGGAVVGYRCYCRGKS